MKKIYHILPMLLLLCTVACHTDKHEIEETGYKYIVATSEYDIATACLYCTAETADGLRTVEERFLPLLDSTYIQINSQAEVAIKQTKITSDTTAYIIYSKKTPLSNFQDTIFMRLRDGLWLAHMPISIPPILNLENYVHDDIDSNITLTVYTPSTNK